MTCAGCDPCPPNSWHLHVTVLPHRSWTLRDAACALEKELRRQDALKMVRITNIFRDPSKRPYVELIPTKHLENVDEAAATYQLFRMSHYLSNNGWRIRRMKLEADARLVPTGRALYYESHVKHSCLEDLKPISVNGKGEKILTIRRINMGQMYVAFEHYAENMGMDFEQPRIEACTIDTNPSLDSEWINQ